VSLGGRIHLLLAAFAVLMLACVLCGFKYVEYLVPMRVTRDWLLSWRVRRYSQRHAHPPD
jgi:hypothetical protein